VKGFCFILIILVALLSLLTGCAPVISKQIRTQVAKDLTLSIVSKDPEAYKGKVVLWSGIIVKSVNVKEGTLIEVLQKPAGRRGKPKDVDKSEGRFLVLYPGYLDVAIYSQGRKITVAGEVKGKKIKPLGEVEYTYPLISSKEIYLWPKEKEVRYPYPHYFYYWPYPFYPYWYPYPCWW